MRYTIYSMVGVIIAMMMASWYYYDKLLGEKLESNFYLEQNIASKNKFENYCFILEQKLTKAQKAKHENKEFT